MIKAETSGSYPCVSVETKAIIGDNRPCPNDIHRGQNAIDRRYQPCEECHGTANKPATIEEKVPVTFQIGYYGTLTLNTPGGKYKVAAVDAELVYRALSVALRKSGPV